jgi:hypothetical protein
MVVGWVGDGGWTWREWNVGTVLSSTVLFSMWNAGAAVLHCTTLPVAVDGRAKKRKRAFIDVFEL